MNNYIKLYWYNILLAIFLLLLGMSVFSYFFLYVSKIVDINFYVFTPLITISSYSLVFTTYYLICLRPRKEILKINYSTNGLKLFPIVLILFFGQYFISEFLTGLIPTQGKILGKMYHNMSYALLGNATKFPFITFISVCIIAPIFEEIFFRGFILKGMLNNHIKPEKAIFISAFIFGGIHIFPWQVIGGVLAGLIFGLTFYKTGSLLISTLLHFINNFIGFLFFMRYRSLETPNFGFNSDFLLSVGIIIVFIFGYLYLKLTKNKVWKYY